MTSARPERAGRPTWRRILVPGLAALAIVVGGLLIWRAEVVLGTQSNGWFAYAPLSDTTFTPSSLGSTTDMLHASVALLGLGFVVLAFWSGQKRRVAAEVRGVPGGRGFLRSAAPIAAGAVAVVVGAVLLRWDATHLMNGWHELRGDTFAVYSAVSPPTFPSVITADVFGPAQVGAALLVAGLAAIAFAIGGVVRRADPATRK